MPLAYVGIGSNLEDPVRQVRSALDRLDRIDATRVSARSSLYRTAPVGETDQPDFVNAVAALESALDARTLFARLMAIEQSAGRVRTRPNAARTLDLDLLLYDDASMESSELTLPHPRMHERAFVLVPLVEIAPGAVIPGRGAAAQLLARIDRSGVLKLP